MNILALGTCRIQNCIYDLQSRGRARSIMGALGFGATPYTMNAKDGLQLLEFARGNLTIPEHVRRYIYPHAGVVPPRASAATLQETDFLLMEFNHPFELRYKDWIVQRRTIEHLLVDQLNLPVRPWFDALFRLDVGRTAAAAKVLSDAIAKLPSGAMPDDVREFTQEFVHHVTCRRMPADELAEGIRALRACVNRPLGISPFAAAYMRGGRFVYWPGGYLEDMRNAARMAHAPLFDPEGEIKKYPEDFALRTMPVGGFGYYSDEFQTLLGEAYMAFCAELAGSRRPSTAGPAYGQERLWCDGGRPYLSVVTSQKPAAPAANALGEGGFRTGWYAYRAALAPTDVQGPGAHAAARIIDNAELSAHDIRRNFSLSEQADALSFSLFAKAGARDRLYVLAGDFMEHEAVTFDLAGARVDATRAKGAKVSLLTCSATPMADGWVWCQASWRFKEKVATGLISVALADARLGIYYAGDGAGDVLLAGPRLEAGERATLDFGAPAQRAEAAPPLAPAMAHL